ncbi:S1C family serine protease [Thiovibrio sp. JS02]
MFLPVALLLCSWLSSAQAREIHLKNGKVIRNVEWVRLEAGMVRYGLHGGTVAMEAELVERIVSDGAPVADEKAATQRGEAGVALAPAGDDLAAQLVASVKPKTPIEEAGLATVALKSELSFGSGFFISPDGYILTNRHVVRGDAASDKQAQANLAEFRKKLAEYRQVLAEEEGKIVRFQANLTQEWSLFHAQEKQARAGDKQLFAARRAALEERNLTLQEWQAAYQRKFDRYRVQEQDCEKQEHALRERQEKFALLNSFEVVLVDDRRLIASFVTASAEHDLALLKVSGYRTPFLQPGNSRNVAQGAPLYAIGSPLKMKNSVTSGVLSGFRDTLLQTNAEIYPGNSGGPLVNEQGEVIGVNTMKLITEKFEGLGFAISIETALAEFANYLAENK